MDHINNNKGTEECDHRPPPYSPAVYPDPSYTVTTYQVGKNQTFEFELLQLYWPLIIIKSY